MATFEPREKDFLRRLIEGRYSLRKRNNDTKFNTVIANYEDLFEDIVSFLDVPKEAVQEDGTGCFFNLTVKGESIKLSWQSLMRFFTEDRQGIEDVVLTTLYSYATQNTLVREEVIEEMSREGFFVKLSRMERKGLLRKILELSRDNKYTTETTEEGRESFIGLGKHSDFYFWIEHSIREMHAQIQRGILPMNPYLCLCKEEIYSLLPNTPERPETSTSTLNALYSVIAGEAVTRRDYLKANPSLLSSPHKANSNTHSSRVLWLENPSIAFFGATLSILITLCLFIFSHLPQGISLSPYIAISLTIAIACIGWFSILLIQARKSDVSTYSKSFFWNWWLKDYSTYNASRIDSEVKIPLVYDPKDYDSLIDVRTVRERFKIANVIEHHISTEDDIKDLKKTLHCEQVDGLYIFLTEAVERFAIPEISAWSKINEDIPVVYVDYVNANLEYGRIDPTREEGVGLWSLLSQATNRARFWKVKTASLQKIIATLFVLIFVILVVFTIAVHRQKNAVVFEYNKKQDLLGETDSILQAARKLNSDQLYMELLEAKKYLINTGYGEDEASINVYLDVLGLGDSSALLGAKELKEFASTQNENRSTGALLPHSGRNIASAALNLVSDSTLTYRAAFARKDSVNTFEAGVIRDSRIEMVSNAEDILFPPEPAKAQDWNGIICVADSNIILCARFLSAERFAQKAMADSNLIKTVRLLEDRLQIVEQTIGNDSYYLFPDPNHHYYNPDLYTEKPSLLRTDK